MTDSPLNELKLSGRLAERSALRYTPAGVPVCEARIAHASRTEEAGVSRTVEVELPVVALGETAHWLEGTAVGTNLVMTGFLAAKSRNSRQPVLHVVTIEFLEGKNNHGFQVER